MIFPEASGGLATSRDSSVAASSEASIASDFWHAKFFPRSSVLARVVLLATAARVSSTCVSCSLLEDNLQEEDGGLDEAVSGDAVKASKFCSFIVVSSKQGFVSMVAECLSGCCVVDILILLSKSYIVYPDDLGYDKNEVPLDQVGGEGEVECGSANRVRG